MLRSKRALTSFASYRKTSRLRVNDTKLAARFYHKLLRTFRIDFSSTVNVEAYFGSFKRVAPVKFWQHSLCCQIPEDHPTLFPVKGNLCFLRVSCKRTSYSNE